MNKGLAVVLVRTWIDLARNNEVGQEVKKRALLMLLKVLGTNENVLLYMKKHGLK